MKLLDEKLESYFNWGSTNEPWQMAEESIPGFILKFECNKMCLSVRHAKDRTSRAEDSLVKRERKER